MCRKHNPVEIFPRRSNLPADAAEETRLELFLALFGQPDYVMCLNCGKIGHYIASRRGGIRWHGNSIEKYISEIKSRARKAWRIIGQPAPFDMKKPFMRQATGSNLFLSEPES